MIFKRRSGNGNAVARPLWFRAALVAAGTLVLVMIVLAVYWSGEPEIFRVNEKPDNERTVVGYASTDTLIRVAQTLLEKPGGYLTNDIMPPAVFLDNIPNWEFGVLQQVRDLARVFRNDYSRSQSQSQEDPDLSVAEPKFFFDNNSWILPPTEREYRDAIAGVVRYRNRLIGTRGPPARFYARADNLREWLAQVEKRLGSTTRRLGNSVVMTVINTDPATDAAAGELAENVRTPWLEIDDVFFEARGTAWALAHFFRAAEVDFAHVLADKNAEASVRQIIRELEASLQPLRSPVVLNGGGFGLFANHSLVMANYLARANSAVINLRELMGEG